MQRCRNTHVRRAHLSGLYATARWGTGFVAALRFDRFESGVEFAEAGVGVGHGVGVFRRDGGGGADGGFARGGDGGPGVDAGSGKQRGAEGSAFFGFEDFDGVVVDVGLDLSPERAAGASAAEANLIDGDLAVRGRV